MLPYISFTNSIHHFSFTFLQRQQQQQESVTGYCGCSTCLVHFDQGPGGPIRASSRRMLPEGHPLREKITTFRGERFVFHNSEARGAPKLKTTQTLLHLLDLRRRHAVEHFLGQKGPPMLMSMKRFKYSKFNLLEWMHNLGRVWDCCLNFLVGSDAAFDRISRETSQALGVFPDIWTSTVVYLPQVHRTHTTKHHPTHNISH